MQPVQHPVTSPVTALDTSTGSGSTSSASNNDTTITANDFLTLLVAEMKNQDPTADSDPNAYIDQLVQVNSLQQLIQINQDLGSNSSTSASNSGSSNSSAMPAHAISEASRLATSLAGHPAQTHAQVSSMDTSGQLSEKAVQAAAKFKQAIHQS